MKLPVGVAVKNFLGLYVLTPFERELLKRLSEALNTKEREVLAYQLAQFTTVRRLIRHLDVPNAHGFTTTALSVTLDDHLMLRDRARAQAGHKVHTSVAHGRIR